eukprot:CAMPEP_0202873408 /NCGR_PEP_ID=MMETSP1391-20130828/23225_1 /ASSEMBLY_ACC=CAM_ASM_000867 /TAXON_ID=1034604 /ORGANISM="Chlamydomonas leiostraca, Strain SAG 11-49" /LENGTH=475 /DNA_ID=CAMNT_0049554625 /DNA_START=100 /DNA_END=1527 /DNA_ORIENTATION=+
MGVVNNADMGALSRASMRTDTLRGLKLKLITQHVGAPEALETLLVPTVSEPWTSVHELKILSHFGHYACGSWTALLCQAFPNLQHLMLSAARIDTSDLFSSLAQHGRHLSSLELRGVVLEGAGLPAIEHLAELPIVQLTFDDTVREAAPALVRAVSRTLCKLTITKKETDDVLSDWAGITAALPACQQLTEFKTCEPVSTTVLAALSQLPMLQDVSVGAVQGLSDATPVQCRWRRLSITKLTLKQLAQLPVAGIDELTLCDLYINVGHEQADAVLPTIAAAAATLQQLPQVSWGIGANKQPSLALRFMIGDELYDYLDAQPATPYLPCLHATLAGLAPLLKLGPADLSLDLPDYDGTGVEPDETMQWYAAEVRALGRALAQLPSGKLNRLYLNNAYARGEFWLTLHQALESAQVPFVDLYLREGTGCSAQFALFCARTTYPLRLDLYMDSWEDEVEADISMLRGWPGIQVTAKVN